jgi:hypothetical protein
MEGMKAEHRRVIPCLLFLEKEAGQDNPPEKNKKLDLFEYDSLNMIHRVVY